jgi:hypothetical protein
MPRITSLAEILFPIDQEQLLSRRTDSPDLRPITSHLAIINRDTGKPVGIVSRAYGVVSNAEAIDLGKRCARDLLGADTIAELEVWNVDAPATGSHCFVDLVHPTHTLNLLGGDAPAEVYVPYVRVTNSYNGTRALRFDVGFCRKLCANGVIFESDTIRFVYAHLRKEVGGDAIRFDIQPGQLERLAERFRNFVRHARSIPMAEEESREEMRRVVGYLSDEAINDMKDVRRRLQGLAIANQAHETLLRYRHELGPNAYATFNAMTELARTLGSQPRIWRDADAVQKRAGRWLPAFCRSHAPARQAA